jgi:hypothetical protein
MIARRLSPTRTSGRGLHTCLLVVIASVAGVGAAQDGPTGRALRLPAVTDLLGRYAGGDARAADSLAGHPDPTSAVRAFQDQAPRWIAADRRAAPSRRLAAATFALDMARHWAGRGDWPHARALVAWGCAEMRRSPVPTEAERTWHLAAVAVIESGDDWTLLVGRRRDRGDVVKPVRDPVENELRQGHLSHAQARFPDEPRLALAAAVAEENRTWEAGRFGRDLNLRGGLIAGELDRAYLDSLRTADILAEDGSTRLMPGFKFLAQHQLRMVDAVRDLRAQYLALTGRPSVAAEAHARLALVAFRLAEPDEALRQATLAFELARDPAVAYLAHLVTGAIRERQGRDADAVDAYRAALDLFPRAQSATSLLVSRLYSLGRLAEAALLADEFFSTDPAADPWRTYRLGDSRLLAGYLAELRRMFR